MRPAHKKQPYGKGIAAGKNLVIRLLPEQYEPLDREALQTGRSKAEIIRLTMEQREPSIGLPFALIADIRRKASLLPGAPTVHDVALELMTSWLKGQIKLDREPYPSNLPFTLPCHL